MTYIPKHRGEPVTKYRVEYIESERGWGQNYWYTDFDSEQEATEDVKFCNSPNTSPVAPDYYIQATYIGPVDQ